MKFFNLFFVNPSFIKNVDKPVCKDCKYFKYDPIYKDYNYAKCVKFGNKSLITGKIVFEDVTVAREEDCGINGDYFEMRDLMLPPTNM
jgi:hypothetical protein